jgi:hypothetical protein
MKQDSTVLVKKLAVVVVGLLTLTGMVGIGVSFFNQIACEGQPINNNAEPTAEQQILGERIIAQSFVAAKSDMNRIDIFFQTYGRKNTHDVTLRLLAVEKDANAPLAGAEVFKTTFNAGTVRDQAWRTFTFNPIAESAGKAYLIALASPDSVEGNAITVGGIERNSYLPGTAYLGLIPVPADFAFRSCYQMSNIEKLQVLSNQITQSRPGLWGDIRFYGFILLLYGLLLAGFFWKLVGWVSN